RPQMPRPPHTESRSTPSARAASRRLVPSANRPRLPDGAKTTRRSSATRPPAGFAAAAPGFAVGADRRRLAEAADPGGAVRIGAVHNVGAEHGLDVLGVERVHDRRGHAG